MHRLPSLTTLVDGDGMYTFSVRQTDLAGNVSRSRPDNYDLDATAPDTTIDSGPSGPVNTPDVSFTFSSADPPATFECSLNGAAFTPCTSPEDLNGLPTAATRSRSERSMRSATPTRPRQRQVSWSTPPTRCAPTVTEPNPNPE